MWVPGDPFHAKIFHAILPLTFLLQIGVICLRKMSFFSIFQIDDSEYTRDLNMPGFWIWQAFEYTRVFYFLGFWIYQGYISFWMCLNILGNCWMCLIMSKYAAIMNTNFALLRSASQFTIFGNNAKKNLHYFCKIFYRGCLTVYAWGSEYNMFLNMALVLNMLRLGIY